MNVFIFKKNLGVQIM